MNSPDSSVSRPQSAAAENEREASGCSLATTALAANGSAPQSRTPLSTVAVQAVFHKYRAHGEKGSPQTSLQQSVAGVASTNCAPPNAPFVTHVPRTPLVAALAASPAPATAANVNIPEHLDDECDDESNPRSEVSRDSTTDHVCHPRDAVFLPTLGRDQGVPQVQRSYGSAGPRGMETPSSVGSGPGGLGHRKNPAPSGPVGLEPSKRAPVSPPTQRQKPAPTRQQTTSSDRSAANVPSGGPFGSKPSECLVDSSPTPSKSQPAPARQQTTRITQGGNNGPARMVGSKHNECGSDTSLKGQPAPSQQTTPNEKDNADSPNRLPDSSSIQRLQSAPAPSRHQTTHNTGTEGSSRSIPEPPPSPPPPPGNHPYKDPACDPDNPFILQFQDVTSAAFMIRNAITVTPCVHSRLSRMCGMDVFLKKDFMQLTGSFKERGARYALLMLAPEQRGSGIVAASLGNHALALACHGAQLGIPVTVVMPTRAPLAKVSACRAYGANVIIEGDNMGESKNIALELAHRKGLTYINGYDHPHILAGQGTLGLELLEQVCDVDAIVIPVGGGGLLAGVARAVKTLYPNIKIIAVESENCASFSAAQAAGKPVLIENQATIADGLAVPMVGVNSFASASPLVDRMIVVNEDLISLSILRMVEVEKNVVEGAGAAGVAAMLSGQMDDFKGKRVVILACGGNIDVSMLGRCLERGLAADGRLFSFTVFVDQNPTSLPDLFSLISRLGASIKDMTHDRKWESENFFHFPVKIVVETPGASISRELRTALSQMYKKIYFHNNFEPIVSHQPMYPDFPNLDCGGTEKTCKRETNSPMMHGLLTAHLQPHLTTQSASASLACVPEPMDSRPSHLR